jgi:phosphomannomutase
LKQLVVFDLDGTLAESKSALDGEMAGLLGKLLSVVRVAIISGGDWPQFEKQVLSNLPKSGRLQNLSLLPTSGTKFYRYESGWELLYAENFTADQREKILSSLNEAIKASDLKIDQTWGDQIEDRGSQITFSALGQRAPIEAKSKWDPDFEKRKRMQAMLDRSIPEFSVRLGGTTSIDITSPGIDKAYGIHKLREILGIPIADMLFVGDAVFPGGNDYPAKQAGVYSIRVRDPEETKSVVEAIVSFMGVSLSDQPGDTTKK